MPVSKNFKTTYGPWAVVSGASSGIGAEFARQLAAAGLSVAIIARRTSRLEELSREITAAHPAVQVKAITADLSTEAGIQAVADGTAVLDAGLLVNSAGVEVVGGFLVHDAAAHQRLIDVNISAVTRLAHLFARRFVERARADGSGERRGGLIMVSSIVNAPSPYAAGYAASKAYVTTLSLSLRTELRAERVDVLSLEPGTVETEMIARIHEQAGADKSGMVSISAGECVEAGLWAFENGHAQCTPRAWNRFLKFMTCILPHKVVQEGIARVARDMLPPTLIEYKRHEESS